jgi:lipooligosaccharide transport system permease protein
MRVSSSPSLRVVETYLMAYKRTWRFSMTTMLINPIMFLLGMGVGLGSLVDKGHGSATTSLGGVTYLTFLAPGLMAATAMQVAAAESTYPIMAKIKWDRIYEAMLATPLVVRDLVIGQLLWIALRLAQTTVIFLAVMALFGAIDSPLAVLAVPAAVLTGMAIAAPICAWSSTRTNDYALSTVLRFAIMPMFLFSGTFFPVSQLPSGIRPIAYVTPLWHGVDLCRSLALGTAELWPSAGHVLYLAALLALGAYLAHTAFHRRLVL